MNEDELVIRIYEEIIEYLGGAKCLESDPNLRGRVLYDWQTTNEARVKKLTRSLLNNVWNISKVNSEPVPPPDWQAVHIGDGIFVEEENPELNCEVG